MTARRLVLAGTALAVLSIGLPWSFVTGTPGYVTAGYYVNYCDYDSFCTSEYVPGVYIPGLTGGTYPGTDTTARFFIALAVGLALIGGLYAGRRRALVGAAVVGVAGSLLYVGYGLMGGMATLLGASACWWLAARRTPEVEEVVSHR